MERKNFKVAILILIIISILIIPKEKFASSTIQLGDANIDGKIDTIDLLVVLRHMYEEETGKHLEWKLTGSKFTAADTNKDNNVNMTDILLLLRHMAASENTNIRKKYPKWVLGTVEVKNIKNTTKKIEVTDIKLDRTTITTEVRKIERIKATVVPDNATDKTITWTSSDTNRATVNNGVVVALKSGSAIITAKTANGKEKICLVIIKENKSNNTTNNTTTKSTTNNTTNNTTTNNITNNNNTTINKTTKTYGTPITVTKIEVIGPTSLEIGKTAQLKLKVTKSNGISSTITSGVEWSVNNQNATIGKNTGKIVGKTVGTVKVTAKYSGKVSLQFSIDIIKRKPTIVLQTKVQDPIYKPYKSYVQIYVSGIDKNEKVDIKYNTNYLKWSKANNPSYNSSSRSIEYLAYVSLNKKPSKSMVFNITVSAGGVSKQANLFSYSAPTSTTNVPTITPNKAIVSKVTLNHTSYTLYKGNKVTLVASVSPTTVSQAVIWETNNSNVATVSNGIVTAKSSGTAVITAKSKVDPNIKKTCTITVKTATSSSVKVTGITLNKKTASIKVGSTVVLSANVKPTNATNKKVNWYSSNSRVATVSQSGVVRGVGKGSATITVVSADGVHKNTCKVTVTK